MSSHGHSAGFPADLKERIARALASYDADEPVDRELASAVVIESLAVLAAKAPGRSVEVRVPPFGAVQAVEGGTHRRGTPRAVVEMDPATWLRLAIGHITWEQAVEDGSLFASGERSDLSAYLPL